jgi:excisionase family DNA binding protein
MDTYLTVKEFAAYTRVGLQTAYRLIWSGEVKRINIAPKGARRPSWRVRRAAADAFMSSREKGRAA